MRSQQTMSVLLSIAVSLATVVVVLSVKAIADGNPATDSVPRLIPYQGTLDRDGVAFNGVVDMEFQLFDGAAAVQPTWTETQTVNVYQGRFMALLGSTGDVSAATLAAVVGNADDTYLAIVLHPAEGDAVPLASRQRFFPVPYAMWSTASSDFHVEGKLYVRGPDINFKAHPDRGDGGRALVHGTGDSLILDFGGDFSGGTFVEGGALTVRSGSTTLDLHSDGSINSSPLLLNESNQGPVRIGGWLSVDNHYKWVVINTDGANGVAFGYNTNPEQLVLNKSNTFSGGTLLEGAARVSGNLTVDGAVDGGHFTCRTTTCGAQQVEVEGGNTYGSWRGLTTCPADMYMCGIEQRVEDMQGSAGDDSSVNDIRILCCPF